MFQHGSVQLQSKSGTITDAHGGIGASELTIPPKNPERFSGALTEFENLLGRIGPEFSTIDQDEEDEFRTALRRVEEHRAAINRYLPEVRRFALEMGQGGQTGSGSVAYAWADSRGPHSVTVETGPFKLAATERKQSGNFLFGKTCLNLKQYSDDGTNAWATIARKEPARTNSGFWAWNPFDGSITRTSRASYSFDHVEIAGRR